MAVCSAPFNLERNWPVVNVWLEGGSQTVMAQVQDSKFKSQHSPTSVQSDNIFLLIKK